MKTHLRYDLGMGSPCPDEHPQKVMKTLGITYQHATPQTLGDQWWFWDCENVPNPLPGYLSILNIDPHKAIGWGLSEQQAFKIKYSDDEIKQLDVLADNFGKSVVFKMGIGWDSNVKTAGKIRQWGDEPLTSIITGDELD